MSQLIPMTVSDMTVTVPYSVTFTSFDINYLIRNGLGPYVHSITQPPAGNGSLVRDPIMWDRYQYTKPLYKTGTFTCTLTVTDANSETDTAIITFKLEDIPQIPITISGDATVYPSIGKTFSELYQLTGGGVAPYTWSLASGTLPAGLSFSQKDLTEGDGKYGEISGTVTEFGEFSIQISVTDSSVTPITKTKYINIIPQVALELQAPSIPDTWYRNKNYEFTFTALVDESQAYYLEWEATGLPDGVGLSIDSGRLTARLVGAPTNNGTYSPTVKVRNTDNGDSDSVDLMFFVVSYPGGLFAADDTVSTNYGTPVVIDVMANDLGLNTSLVGISIPSNGTAVAESGKIKYTPRIGFFGEDTFIYTLSGGTSTAQGTVTVTVGQPGINDAPTITNAPTSVTLIPTEEYTHTFTASGGVSPYVWSVRVATGQDSGSGWMTINSSTGAFACTVPSSYPEGYETIIEVRVTDSSVSPKSGTARISLLTGTPPYTATIQGTLRLDTSDGAFAARKVYLYNYTTGDKVAETTSDGTTGAWSFTQVAPGDYFVVGAAQGDDLNVPRDFDALGVITVV